MPPQASLYACLFGGLVFWIFCSSRHTAIAVTSAISLLMGATLGEIAGNDPVRATAALQTKFPSHAELIGAWYGRFDEMLAPPYPEMVALVGRLQAAGIGLHLLSNAPGFMTEWLATGRLRAAHPFLAAFGAIVVSDTVGCSKPDRAIYDLTAAQGGFAPEEAVFLDDALGNVEGARAAGWRAIHHREPAATIAALREMGLTV